MSTNDSAGPSTPGKGRINEKQLELLCAVMQNSQGKLDTNWDGVATQAGYKTAASAREVYRVLAKKLGWDAKPTTTTGTPKNKSSSSSSAVPTPTRVQKSTGRVGTKRGKNTTTSTTGGGNKKKTAKNEEYHNDDDDDDEDGVGVKKEGLPRVPSSSPSSFVPNTHGTAPASSNAFDAMYSLFTSGGSGGAWNHHGDMGV